MARRDKDYPSHAHEAADGLNSLLSDLLLLTRSLAGELKLEKNETTITALMEGAVKQSAGAGRADKIVVDTRIPQPSEALLACDRDLVMRALQHVIDNAFKFSSEDTSIRVACMQANSGALIITVQDQGQGLESGRVEELMQPFSQGDMANNRSKEGVGIGLSIAKIAAESHGGQLIIHSTPGEGTTVGIVLPASRLSLAPEAADGRQQAEAV